MFQDALISDSDGGQQQKILQEAAFAGCSAAAKSQYSVSKVM
jgi:hypothetical protein